MVFQISLTMIILNFLEHIQWVNVVVKRNVRVLNYKVILVQNKFVVRKMTVQIFISILSQLIVNLLCKLSHSQAQTCHHRLLFEQVGELTCLEMENLIFFLNQHYLKFLPAQVFQVIFLVLLQIYCIFVPLFDQLFSNLLSVVKALNSQIPVATHGCRELELGGDQLFESDSVSYLLVVYFWYIWLFFIQFHKINVRILIQSKRRSIPDLLSIFIQLNINCNVLVSRQLHRAYWFNLHENIVSVFPVVSNLLRLYNYLLLQIIFQLQRSYFKIFQINFNFLVLIIVFVLKFIFC
ncbi:Hypothetical_protein [Hexamita inflata]|uniref:Hypothetical_protein n=1 Tax=Hexamita inflata TaxID=28002 RepID=A0AA86TJE1_9EUKA|nr:Hypothetical protein HINF_LOCUS5207 [Hexamita inflata]